MELRESTRYQLSDIFERHMDINDFHCRFDFDANLRGRLVDLSLKGFGFEIHTITSSQAGTLKKLGSYMMTVFFAGDTVIASVKNIWNRVVFDQGIMVFKGGVEIDVISPEDRLKLSTIIEKIRSNQ